LCGESISIFYSTFKKSGAKKQFGLISVSNLDVFAPLFLKVEEKIESVIFM
jgi:hypothetical protein